jgi:hypothetical protein
MIICPVRRVDELKRWDRKEIDVQKIAVPAPALIEPKEERITN